MIKQYLRDGRAPIPRDESTSRIMSSIKSKDTKPEIRLRKLLWANGIRGYRIHWKKVPGKPDIAFPGRQVAVFVNGCFWHQCPICKRSLPKSHTEFWREKLKRNVERDKRKVRQLNEMGWSTATIWACQIKEDPIGCVARVASLYHH